MKTIFGLFLAMLVLGYESQADTSGPLTPKDLASNQSSEFGLNAVIHGLKLAQQEVDKRTPEDGIDRAEGYRFILRLLAMNLEPLVGDSDPAYPLIRRGPTLPQKLGFDSPDYNYISTAALSPEFSYRVFGSRGDAPVMLFQVVELSKGGAFSGNSTTDSDKIVVDDQGNWEVFLSASKPEGVPESNWLKLTENSHNFLIRVAIDDWNAQVEPSVQIEVIDRVEEGAAPVTPQRFAVAGYALSQLISTLTRRWIEIVQTRGPLNDIDTPCRSWVSGCRGGGFGNFSSGGRYQLEEDEALIIETLWVPAKHRNIQLANLWGESHDYGSKQTSLNGFQAQRDDDGMYRYVLAHRDPGVPNWLDVSDHPEGAIFMRWVLTEEGKQPLKPNGTVIPLSEVRKHLPATTPVVTPEQRAEVLKQRLAGLNKRRNPAGL